MPEFINELTRELAAKLGHGGFMCALKEGQKSEFMCRVPWKECTVYFYTPEPEWIGIGIWVWNPPSKAKRDAQCLPRTPMMKWEWEYAMHDPSWSPHKLVDDIVGAIKEIKAYFKRKPAAIDKHFVRIIDDTLGQAGQTATS